MSTLAQSQPPPTSNTSSALVTSNTSLLTGHGSHISGTNHVAMLSPASSNSPREHQYPASSEKSPDELLNIFRTELARQVPFVSIPPHMNARELSEQKPFIYQAITFAASYHDSIHQMSLGQAFVKNLNEHIILMGKKTLDLLQGLLIYITW